MAQTITMRQRVAIGRARRAGRKIARKYPSIADDYDAGSTQPGLVDDYNIMEEFGLTRKIAINAVQNALYELNPGRMKELARQHLSESGKRLHRDGKAAFSLTKEEKREQFRRNLATLTDDERKDNLSRFGRKGGSISGPKTYEEGKGIHGLSDEDRRKYGRMAAQAAWGATPWSDEEFDYFAGLCKKYFHKSGPHKGRPKYKVIMDELEKKFRNGRTIYSLRVMGGKLRKQACT